MADAESHKRLPDMTSDLLEAEWTNGSIQTLNNTPADTLLYCLWGES